MDAEAARPSSLFFLSVGLLTPIFSAATLRTSLSGAQFDDCCLPHLPRFRNAFGFTDNAFRGPGVQFFAPSRDVPLPGCPYDLSSTPVMTYPMAEIARLTHPSGEIMQPLSSSRELVCERSGTAVSRTLIHSHR